MKPARAMPSSEPPRRRTQGGALKRPARLTAADRARIDALFARLEQLSPEPKGELVYTDAFSLLVAVVLSAQATDISVNKATRTLFQLAPTPQAMLELGEARVSEQIRTIGLYRTKAKNVIALSRILVEQFGGRPPLQRDALQSLPGVGRKTASVVLNELGVEPAIAVDTHVFRVSQRLGLSKATTPDGVEKDLMARVPERYRTRAHHWLILHGRYVCLARRPRCQACPIAEFCPSRALFGEA